MGFFNWLRRDDAHGTPSGDSRRATKRRCRIEKLQDRRPMAADIYLGSVYYEDTTDGEDTTPDVIDITWVGGPAGAELKTLTINMDKNGNGTLDPGETFFDTSGTNFGVGQFGNADMEFIANGFTITSVTPLGGSGIPGDWDGATGFTLTFSGFNAGEHLLVKVDIDEQGFFGGASSLVEGDEFQYSKIAAEFAAPHYKNVSGATVYLDDYPDAKADQVGLPRDDYTTPPALPVPLRTAGGFLHLTPEPLGSIRGNVHADYDGDCLVDPGEPMLAGVTIQLLDANGSVIATTLTDANGEYEFLDLEAGTYGVREIQPTEYFNGGTLPGTINGTTVGTSPQPNVITGIQLAAGQQGVEYNFCEKLGSISGRVHVDVDGDCDYEPQIGDFPIQGVTIQLLDSTGAVIATTTTAADGTFRFDRLFIGTYSVREIQPTMYFNGGQDAGTINGAIVGTEATNQVNDIQLTAATGRDAIDYDFCERVGSISGRVHVDVDDDCDFEPQLGDYAIQGVTIQLLDASGNVIATTTTAADGTYKFSNLTAGTYAVREVQPTKYFNGGQDAGTINGVIVGTESSDKISEITLTSGGRDAVDYDFCERLGSIRGRVIVDVDANNQVNIDPEKPLAGVTILLLDSNGTVLQSTVTDADGRYLFDRLERGTYTVVEVQPTGYQDGQDYVGKIGGTVIGNGSVSDVLSNITLLDGRHGVEYDFTEFPLKPPFRDPPPPDVPQMLPPPPPPGAVTPLRPLDPLVVQPDPLPVYTGVGANGYTWHLSVVNGGQPRTPRMTNSQLVARSREVGELLNERPDWNSDAVRRGEWILRTGDEDTPTDRKFVFGVDNGIPVTGDFNGDGNTDVGVFRHGHWYVDLNGNGKWDEGDMWARLGHRDDLPVTGDWDGDGKVDIAIFGREWPGDSRHIAAEPGLPSDVNAKHGKTKNVPPTEQDATLGIRALQLTSAGKVRTDLIDHVFLYGWAGDRPIAGDWTGEGQSMVGLFREGSWVLDLNGDGKYDQQDRVLSMGQPGDLPVIGDFNGDTRTDLGIYRNGLWHIDTNNDGVLDARDRAFQFGEGADRPVVGDWDGDGVDDPGLYRDLGRPTGDAE